jgi:hypothetical protein
MLARRSRAVEIAFSGKRSISSAQTAAAQGQIFWPSIDSNCMSRNFKNSKDNYENPRLSCYIGGKSIVIFLHGIILTGILGHDILIVVRVLAAFARASRGRGDHHSSQCLQPAVITGAAPNELVAFV